MTPTLQPKVASLTKATRERPRKARAMKKGPARSATVRGSVSGSEPSLKNFSSSDLIPKHGVFRSDDLELFRVSNSLGSCGDRLLLEE